MQIHPASRRNNAAAGRDKRARLLAPIPIKKIEAHHAPLWM
jgi:hypothetical protein